MTTPTKYAIRLALHGCTNRPFYHIVVANIKQKRDDPDVEQIGSYDPIPNKLNEKLIACNFTRLKYWLARGAEPNHTVAELLGLSGYLPIYPRTLLMAARNKKSLEEKSKVEISDVNVDDNTNKTEMDKENSKILEST